MKNFRWLSLVVFLLPFSCSKPLPVLEGIDREKWKKDKNACLGERAAMIQTLRSEKEKLKALDEMTLVELLGPPDQHELYKRNQKFYFYFLEPGPPCSGSSDSLALRLSIRFNATGLSKEITIE